MREHRDIDTRGEANAANAALAVRMLRSTAHEDQAATDTAFLEFASLAADDQAAAVADAITDLWHLCDGLGLDMDERAASGRDRYREEVEDEQTEIENRAGLVLVKCPECGERVDETKLWHEPCARCKAAWH